MIKTCTKCGTDKPDTDYYANRNACKECIKAKASAWYAANAAYVSQRDTMSRRVSTTDGVHRPRTLTRRKLAEWFLEHRTEPVNGCLEVTGMEPGSHGYYSTRFERKTIRLHRLIFAELVGHLPDTDQVHHTCANRACIRPGHLQRVTQRENMAEMQERNAYRARISELESALRALSPEHTLLGGPSNGTGPRDSEAHTG
ncbi:HNH endonuclease signature motif containing protein [Streptomyces sp. NPDC050421]|uniref:HNH endonuclease signature motif containing protein n=1 Tax=Streptomyces sp. NPDC050421 TaxID=3365613 RepID=UPI00378EC068